MGGQNCLQDTELKNGFEGFKMSDFHTIMKRAGDDVSESDIA
jgi:hypothetical protein